MKKLEKYLTDERTRLTYELIGDYYFIAGDDEPDEKRPIGIWGQRRLRYIRRYNKLLYSELLLYGKLNDHLADIDKQAEEMFSQLVVQLPEKDGITEALKVNGQMEWVRRMNAVRVQATEIVNHNIVHN